MGNRLRAKNSFCAVKWDSICIITMSKNEFSANIFYLWFCIINFHPNCLLFLREAIRATKRVEVVVEIGEQETLEQLCIPSNAKHLCIKHNGSSLKS